MNMAEKAAFQEALIKSDDLFAKGKPLMILHQQAVYVLSVTKQDKLILTKLAHQPTTSAIGTKGLAV